VSTLLDFPNPVNEKAARTVAAVVALTAILALATGWLWLLYPLALGFLARVATGPTLSPLGRFAMWFAGAHLGRPRYVPGPPKRFAQGIGAVCTTAGAVALALSGGTIPVLVLGLMVVFATLESAFAFCAGCAMFAGLMRLGLVPERVCLECANVAARRA
jgi:uncharacterized protein DUF4395